MKILLVEDDDCQMRWLQEKLTARGFEVHSAQNGDEGFAAYRKNRPFDAVVTDFQCSGSVIRNGVYLVRAVRKLDPNQLIVIQTSEKELLIPGVPQLHKPYPLHRLIRLLRLPVQPLLF